MKKLKLLSEPEIIVELIDNSMEMIKYTTNGSLGIDIYNREEIIIPCNNYFKQTQNTVKYLFELLKDIYEGKMKKHEASEFENVEKTINNLNNQYNIYHQVLIPMNIKIQYPEGYGAKLLPRSSTFKKYGLIQTNSEGLIDSDFVKEHKFPVINLTNKDAIIPAGTLIAQLEIVKKENINIKQGKVEDHENHNGFGSTDLVK